MREHDESMRYYNYEKRKPLVRRLFSLGRCWVVYCDRCGKPVPWDRIMFGIDIAPGSMKMHVDEIAAIQLIRKQDWSMIAAARRPVDWYRKATLKVYLGFCQGCQGPFSVLGKTQGVIGDGLHLASAFLGELNHAQALVLLEIALTGDLYGNDSYRDQAVETCKTLGSAIDFEAFHAARTEQLAGLDTGHRALQAMHAGRHQEALDGLHKAIEVFKRTGHGRLEAMSWMNIGLVYRQQCMRDEAQAAFNTAVMVATAHNEPQTAIASHILLAEIHRERDDFGAAESSLHCALGYDVGLPDTMSGAMSACFKLAAMLTGQRRNDEVREHLEKALELSRQLGASDGIEHAEAALQDLDR